MLFGQPTILSSYSDLALLDEYYLTGNIHYRNTLLHRYSDQIMDSCAYFLNYVNPGDAADVTAEVIEVAIKRLEKRPEIKKFAGWIFIVTRNFCFAKNSKNHRLNELFQDFAENYPFDHVNIPDDDTLYLKELRYNAMLDTIEDLSDTQQKCIYAFYWQGLSYDDIAIQCELKKEQVRAALQGARNKLRSQIGHL